MLCDACSNEQFQEAVARREQEDLQQLQAKLKRALDEPERQHCGVSQLREFLERLLQRRYLDSVPLIVPLLEQEFRNVVRAASSGALGVVLVIQCTLALQVLECLGSLFC